MELDTAAEGEHSLLQFFVPFGTHWKTGCADYVCRIRGTVALT